MVEKDFKNVLINQNGEFDPYRETHTGTFEQNLTNAWLFQTSHYANGERGVHSNLLIRQRSQHSFCHVDLSCHLNLLAVIRNQYHFRSQTQIWSTKMFLVFSRMQSNHVFHIDNKMLDVHEKLVERDFDKESMITILLVRQSGSFLKRTRQVLKQMDLRTRKLKTMHKALYPRDDVDRRYVSRKERGRGLTGTEDSVEASIQRFEDYIENRGGKLITAAKNNTDNMKTNRM